MGQVLNSQQLHSTQSSTHTVTGNGHARPHHQQQQHETASRCRRRRPTLHASPTLAKHVAPPDWRQRTGLDRHLCKNPVFKHWCNSCPPCLHNQVLRCYGCTRLLHTSNKPLGGRPDRKDVADGVVYLAVTGVRRPAGRSACVTASFVHPPSRRYYTPVILSQTTRSSDSTPMSRPTATQGARSFDS